MLLLLNPQYPRRVSNNHQPPLPFPGQLWGGRRLGNCVPKKCRLMSFSAASLRPLVFSFPCLPSGHTTARSAARVIKSQQFSWFRFLGKRSPSLGAARAASSTTRHALSLRSEAGRAKSDGTPLPQVVAVAGVPEGNMGSYFATAGPLRRRRQQQQQKQQQRRRRRAAAAAAALFSPALAPGSAARG